MSIRDVATTRQAPTAESVLSAALWYAGRGWHVLPLHSPTDGGQRCSCGDKSCDRSIGKHPRTPSGVKDASIDETVIRAWWEKWPAANVGIACGARSGIFMIGPDGAEGAEALETLQLEHGHLPATLQTMSGSGGGSGHLLFAWPGSGGIGNRANHRSVPIDTRGEGGYFVAPPSLHKSGNRYEWISDPAEEAAQAPAWLLEWAQKPSAPAAPKASTNGRAQHRFSAPGRPDSFARAQAYLSRCEPAVSGQRGHNRLLWAARVLVYGYDLDQHEAFSLLASDYNPRCDPPWSDRELRHKIEEADAVPFDKPRGWLRDEERPQKAAPRPRVLHEGNGHPSPAAESSRSTLDRLPQTDVGNGKRLAERHGHQLRHVSAWNAWAIWDGARWRFDDTGEISRRAKEVTQHLYLEACEQMKTLGPSDGRSDDERLALSAHYQRQQTFALKSQFRQRLEAMIVMARSEPGIALSHAHFDRHPFLLCCPNGTVDLATGRIKPNRQENLITQLCPLPFEPSARCPVWERSLRAILGDDEGLVSYFQRLAGYSLTGDTREAILPICHGNGSNGKSLVFEVLRKVLGPDYASVGADELLRPDWQRGHQTYLADLRGKRLVTLAETGEGGKLNEALIKQLTGGESLKARRMREDFWEFVPVHKLWIATNHRPAIMGTDHGIWRRLRLIPFTVRFWDPDRGEQGDDHLRMDRALLARILPAEGAGILAWMVRGCLAWQREGLKEPEKVKLSTSEYRAEQDVIGCFLQDCCLIGPDEICKSSTLYETYQKWHERTGQYGRVMSQTKFTPEVLKREGLGTFKSSVKHFSGLSVLPEDHFAGGLT